MLASSLSRVIPALCTTMSRPPCRVAGVLEDPLPGVGGRHVELEGGAADPVRGAGQGLPRRRDVDAHHGGAVAREHVGDGRTDPPGGTGDHGHLARERPRPVRRLRQRARTDPHDLAVDVCRAAGEQEAQARVGVVVGAVVHEDEVGGGSGAQLLADGAGDALEGPSRRGLRATVPACSRRSGPRR